MRRRSSKTLGTTQKDRGRTLKRDRTLEKGNRDNSGQKVVFSECRISSRLGSFFVFSKFEFFKFRDSFFKSSEFDLGFSRFSMFSDKRRRERRTSAGWV